MSARITLLVGLAIAIAGLSAYNRQKLDPEAFGLDPDSILAPESWGGVRFTAPYIPNIRDMIEAQRDHPPQGNESCRPTFILWLGNSQLHYINHFEKGEHIAPYWLREALECPDATVPLGVSVSGANPQEQYVLAEYVERRLRVRGMVLALSFNDLRDDGLRDDFSGLLDASDQVEMRRVPAGEAILARAQAVWQGRNRADDNSAIAGSIQWQLENMLDASLARDWSLWANRRDLRTLLYVDLYQTRNAVFGIKSTTLRRMIPQYYERNMLALDGLLKNASERRIPLIAYILPIRPDVPKPYDPAEYDAWKREVAAITAANNAVLLDFESLVPAADWDPPSGNVDFTHFDGNAHKLLAAALLPHLQALLKGLR
jgi:hypothetical protein